MPSDLSSPLFRVQNRDEATVTAQKIYKAIPATPQWYTEEKGCKKEQRYWRFSLLQKRAKKESLISWLHYFEQPDPVCEAFKRNMHSNFLLWTASNLNCVPCQARGRTYTDGQNGPHFVHCVAVGARADVGVVTTRASKPQLLRYVGDKSFHPGRTSSNTHKLGWTVFNKINQLHDSVRQRTFKEQHEYAKAFS